MDLNYTKQEILHNYGESAQFIFDKYQNGKSIDKTDDINNLTFRIIAYKSSTVDFSFSLRAVYNSWYGGLGIQNPNERLLQLAREAFNI